LLLLLLLFFEASGVTIVMRACGHYSVFSLSCFHFCITACKGNFLHKHDLNTDMRTRVVAAPTSQSCSTTAMVSVCIINALVMQSL
jgi:hypothetical protein